MSEGQSGAFAGTGLPFSVKLEDTQKGIRITVHVYSADLIEAAKQAVKLRDATALEIEAQNVERAAKGKSVVAIAPMGVNEK